MNKLESSQQLVTLAYKALKHTGSKVVRTAELDNVVAKLAEQANGLERKPALSSPEAMANSLTS